jgi:DNA-binding response OmpR family regulator
MLVEDEALIACFLEEALIDHGYHVIWAQTGSLALAMMDERIEQVAGLITDIRLGEGPNGWNVARHGRVLRPELPVLYMTGDSGADWGANGVPESILLEKPFVPEQLLNSISTLLHEVGGHG